MNQLGPYGEELVASWLERQGATVIERNFSCRLGEIDIIASKDSTVAFIEVKTRNRELFDTSYVITPTKQHRIVSTAKLYLAKHNLNDHHCRFDVAIVTIEPPHLRYIRNAFYGA
jgi:putative endonuclease